MRLEYTLTFTDYKAALRLHRRQTLGRRLFPMIGPAMLLACIIGFVVSSFAHNLVMAEQSISLGGGSLVLTVGLPIERWIRARRCYRRMFPPTRTSRTTIIEIDEEKIVEINPGAEEIQLNWTGVLNFVQDEKITMIYIGVARFFLIPTPILTPSQRAELAQLASRRFMQRQSC